MFNLRHKPRALSRITIFGVVIAFFVILGSYDASADLNSEFVKGKSKSFIFVSTFYNFHYDPNNAAILFGTLLIRIVYIY